MIVEIVALLLATAVGVALAIALDRSARGALLGGEAVLLGIGASAAILFAFAAIHVPWSRGAVFATLIAVGTISAVLGRNRNVLGRTRDVLGGAKPHWLDLVTLLLLAGYARLATMAPVWEFDYIGDFGVKARNFWEARTIDWPFLQSLFQRAAHPDYPPLLPLSFDLLALARGAWNDDAHGLLNVAFAIALLLIVRHLANEETESRTISAFITLAILPLAASPWIGLGEAPLVAFGTAAVLLLRGGDDSRVAMAAVLLGLAASSKNEGLTLIVAVAIALAIAGRARTIVRLWPAVVIATPWMIARAVHHLPSDLAGGNVPARIAAHLAHPMTLLEPLATYPLGKPLFWFGIVVAMIVLRRRFFDGERFAVAVIVLQFAFYIGAYLASPHDLDWHVRWSWERLVSHLTPLLAYVLLVNLGKLAFGRRTPIDALQRGALRNDVVGQAILRNLPVRFRVDSDRQDCLSYNRLEFSQPLSEAKDLGGGRPPDPSGSLRSLSG